MATAERDTMDRPTHDDGEQVLASVSSMDASSISMTRRSVSTSALPSDRRCVGDASETFATPRAFVRPPSRHGFDNSGASASFSERNKPGVAKSRKRSEQDVLFLHNKAKTSQVRPVRYKLCWSAWESYSMGFRYLVLFKWTKHLPHGRSIRKRLSIPALLTFWLLLLTLVCWAMNLALFISADRLLADQKECQQQCIDSFANAPPPFNLDGFCLRKLTRLSDLESNRIMFLIINAVYFTICALFSIQLVLALTRSLRYVGKALDGILKKRHFNDILKNLTYSQDDATLEVQNVIRPLQSLFRQGLSFRKQAEVAESKWSEVAQKAEVLKALLNIREQEGKEGKDGEGEGTHEGDGEGRRRGSGLSENERSSVRALFSLESNLTLFTTTWNVGNACPPSSIGSWLGHASMFDIVCVGVQECSYQVKEGGGGEGKGATPLGTPKLTGRNLLKNTVPHWGCASHFQRLLQDCLGPDFYCESKVYISGADTALEDVASIRLFVFVKKRHEPWVQTVTKSVVKRGITGTFLNKGAVAVSLSVYGMRIALINAHFQAHMKRVEERNHDFTAISRKLFTTAGLLSEAHPMGSPISPLSPVEPTVMHHVVIWMGDLNYRLDLSHAEAMAHIRRCKDMEVEDWGALLAHDQLRKEKASGNIFAGFREEPIAFMPTYKLNEDRTGYDTKRVPAWCDRILWKAIPHIAIRQLTYASDCIVSTSDHHPVSSTFAISHVLPITHFPMKPLSSYKQLRFELSDLMITFSLHTKTGRMIEKNYTKLDAQGVLPASRDEAHMGKFVLSSSQAGSQGGDGGGVERSGLHSFRMQDISKLAPHFVLAFFGKFIRPSLVEEWTSDPISLALHLDLVQGLSSFPEPLIIAVHPNNSEDAKQADQPSIRLHDEDEVPREDATAESHVSNASAVSGRSPRTVDLDAVKDLRIGGCLGECHVDTLSLFRQFGRRGESCEEYFCCDLLRGGEVVGSMQGHLILAEEGAEGGLLHPSMNEDVFSLQSSEASLTGLESEIEDVLKRASTSRSAT